MYNSCIWKTKYSCTEYNNSSHWDLIAVGCIQAVIETTVQCNNYCVHGWAVEKYLQNRRTSYFLFLRSSEMFKGPFIPCKITFTKYCITHQELWNPLSKAVPGKFHGSGGHSKRNCLQDRANFHRSRAWQIVLIINTVWVAYPLVTYFSMF